MAKTLRNFIQGRMNKSVDERLVPQGEYIDALNVRLGSTENSEIGSVENSKGNELLIVPEYPSGTTYGFKTLGSFADTANETIYWFVHADATGLGATNVLDIVLSYNIISKLTTYHMISIDDGSGTQSTLNFTDKFLINGINKVNNLIFFTDNYNPPRFFDVTKNYENPTAGNIDQFTAEEILVIKKPPMAAPSIELLNIVNDETYLEERLICFAYRYRYENDEYSATSQFTQPAFDPKSFNLSLESGLNEGMVNEFNAVNLSYNTGSSLVKEIQILFKEADKNLIKVIESFNKEELGLGDNNTETVLFDNSKIFTILEDSEILRLYDNVPLLAKSQTLMGNRLMYGNYYEGYDLVDSTNEPIIFNYVTELDSTIVNETDLPITKQNAAIDMDCTSGSPVTYTVTDGQMIVYLTEDGLVSGTPLVLKQGASLVMDISFNHQGFGGNISGAFTPPDASGAVNNLQIEFVFPRDYTSAFDLATSSEFIQYIGSPTNFTTVQNCANGVNVSSVFNCIVPQNLINASGGSSTTLTKCWSGTSDVFCTGGTATQDFAFANLGIVTSSTDPNVIGIKLMAMAYVDTCVYSGGATATQVVYNYYKIVSSDAAYKDVSNPKTLKSNRNYETAIVYMDDFGRSSTPIVSPQNTIPVPCSESTSVNKIKVTIPVAMKAPKWASKYKFVVQPDRDTYNTIYTNIFFLDPNSTRVWCLLDGENAQKVEKGDRLIVKRDTLGVQTSCVYTTVLEKEAQVKDFITIPIEGSTPARNVAIPSGSYMALTPSNWSAATDNNNIYNPGSSALNSDCSGGGNWENPNEGGDNAVTGYYPFSNLNPTAANPPTVADPKYVDVDVPQGSVINWFMKFQRRGPGDGNRRCERVVYTLDLRGLVARNSYANVYDWFIGDNIEAQLNSGTWDVGDSGSNGNFIFDDTLYYGGTTTSTECGTAVPASQTFGTDSVKTYYMRFARATDNTGSGDNNILMAVVQGGINCGRSDKRRSSLKMDVQIIRSEATLVFESEPLDASPGIFYEGEDNYDITGGLHMSGTNVNDVNQTASVDGVVYLNNFNAFTYGNGVESYKIRDSISGKGFSLGNRVFGATEQIYKRAHRFSDITYSGIYNDESNINKLNEFNLGLVNFKQLEESYGPIEVLSGRKTDVLALQEDKITYVLAGKNLLSDAAGGSSLTSVPEVLGTQIARVEDYGISNNPESYTEWGADKFFTDVKRGAIIQLKGVGGTNEALGVISERGMRGYFRDLFIESSLTQKIGGFDPYMNEYVLSINNTLLPQPDLKYNCGVDVSFICEAGTPQTFVYLLNNESGNARFNYNVGLTSGSTTTFVATYLNGSGVTQTVSSGAVSTDGFITIVRDVPSITEVSITATQTAGNSEWTIRQDCPLSATLNVVQVCLTRQDEDTLSNYNQFFWNIFPAGSPAPPYSTNPLYSSPTTSTFVDFQSGATPTVSQYSMTTGQTGLGSFPPTEAYVTIQSNKLPPANFQFEVPGDKFRYLESNTLYQNNATDINALVAASTQTNTNFAGQPTVFNGQFARGLSNTTYLYMIWDYRNLTSVQLRYQAGTADLIADRFNACCVNAQAFYSLNGATLSSATVVYTSQTQTTAAADGYYSDGVVVRLQKLGTLQPDTTNCTCGISCGPSAIYYKTAAASVFQSRHLFTASTGAVVITWLPWEMPKGIDVIYNGVRYNKWTSQTFGDVSPNSLNTPVYLGVNGTGVLPTSGNYPVAELDSASQYVVIPNTTQYVAVGTGQIKTTATNPQVCTLVVPKTSATTNYLDVEIFNLLSSSDYLSTYFSVACPVALTSADADVTQTYSTSALACGGATDQGGSIFVIPSQYPGAGGWSVGTRVYANANGTSPAVNTDSASPGYADRTFSTAGFVLTGITDPGTGGEQAIELNDESVIVSVVGCSP